MLRLFNSLAEADRKSLLDFAEFLASRQNQETVEEPQHPKPIPRPENESVVKAIKRLSSSYFMIDKSTILNETSSLMSQHVMQGKPAPAVIDELEQLFRDQYDKFKGSDQ